MKTKTVRKKSARKVAKATTRKVAKKVTRKVAKKKATVAKSMRKIKPEHFGLKQPAMMPNSVIDRINAHAAGKNPIDNIVELAQQRYSTINVVAPSTTALGGIRPSANANEVYVPREEVDKRYINWTKNDIKIITKLRKRGHSIRSLRLVFGTSWAPIKRVMLENGIK